jgi:N-methylhydantoinase B
MRVLRYRLREGSGGAGRFRGGEGIERDLLFLKDVTVRKHCEPSSDASATPSGPPWSLMPDEPLQPPPGRAREGNRGTSLSPA